MNQLNRQKGKLHNGLSRFEIGDYEIDDFTKKS